MSEPYELIERELELISDVQQLADEQRDAKLAHRKNVKSIRAWRINWRKNAEKLANEHTGYFNEDEQEIINNKIRAINIQIGMLNEIKLEKNSYTELKERINHISRYIQELTAQVQSKGYKYDSGEKINTELINQFKKVEDAYKSDLATRRKILDKNKVIREENDSIKKQETAYLKQAIDCVQRINRQLGTLSSDGRYAGIDDSDEITFIDPNEASQKWASIIASRNKGGFNARSLEDLPSQLEGRLYDLFIQEDGISRDANKIALEIFRYINSVINSIDFPTKPTEEYRKELDVPKEKKYSLNFEGSLNEIPVKAVKGTTIPNSIFEEFENYSRGKFSLTAKQADRINEIADKYGTLRLMIEPEIKQSVREINRKIRELRGVYNQFGSERNSSRGKKLIDNLVESTNLFLRHTRNQQRVFDQYYEEFIDAANELKNWVNQAWWQAGGQPANHQKAGKEDGSARTYMSHTSNTAYKGESL